MPKFKISWIESNHKQVEIVAQTLEQAKEIFLDDNYDSADEELLNRYVDENRLISSKIK